MKRDPTIMGIYQIKNTQTSECYIGSSLNVAKRLQEHLRHLANGTHINKLLQYSWGRHGIENFTFTILEVVDDESDLLHREILWINKVGALEFGFNTKTDQNTNMTVVVVPIETKIELEHLEMGSMQSTVSQLLKFYVKYHR